MSFDKLQGPVSGLDHALDQPSASPSLAQNPTVALFPRNSAATRSEQQEAITILLDQHDYDILAYLRFARSLDEKVHHFSDNGTNGSLSSDQVLAVWVLRDCADDEIRSWLEQARKLGESVTYVWILQELTPVSKRS